MRGALTEAKEAVHILAWGENHAMAWQPQGVRFVLYGPPQVTFPDAADLWDRILTPRRPDNTQRSSGGPAIPQSMASGVVRGLNFNLNVQPGRIDFFISPQHTPWDVSKRTTTKDLTDPILSYGLKILDSVAAIRVAIVLDVVAPVDTYEEATNIIYDALPFIPRRADLNELNFQINPQRPFNCANDFMMWRLCRWGAAVIQLVNVQIGAGSGTLGAPSGFSPPMVVEQRNVATFQADLSSRPLGAGETLDTARARAMLEELVLEAAALLETGYGRFEQ